MNTQEHGQERAAAPDKPMVITGTSYLADVVTVNWTLVSYTGCTGYVIGIFTGATKLNNFQVDDPKATSDQVDFACEKDGVYTVLVEPIIRGRPKDSLASDPVGIPYPAA
jgi:hypothetical protein